MGVPQGPRIREGTPIWASLGVLPLPAVPSARGGVGLRDNVALWKPPLLTRALTPETLPHRGQAPWGGAHPGKQAWSSHEVGGWGAWQLPQGPACC